MKINIKEKKRKPVQTLRKENQYKTNVIYKQTNFIQWFKMNRQEGAKTTCCKLCFRHKKGTALASPACPGRPPGAY
ncbi:MAG: hypothetical protein ACK53L_34400 [Pirellulaceae bacterium]